MDLQKLDFITREFISRLQNLTGKESGKWGKMNAQQMVEHVTDFFLVSSGDILMPLQTPEEYLPKFKAFLLSDKEFRENTRAPENIVPEEPPTERNPDFATALAGLKVATDAFNNHFVSNPGAITTHPVFGPLNHEEWVLLHFKHVTHHGKQFGVI